MMFLFSCDDNPPQQLTAIVNNLDGSSDTIPYYIVEADSCEYIKFNSAAATWGGHRGRCKYCAARNNKPCK